MRMRGKTIGAPATSSVDFSVLPTTAWVNSNEGDVHTAGSPITVIVEQVEPEQLHRNQQWPAKARGHDQAQGGKVMVRELHPAIVSGSQGRVISTELQAIHRSCAIDGFAHGDREDVVAAPVSDRNRWATSAQSPDITRTHRDAGSFRVPRLPFPGGAPFATPAPTSTVGDRPARARHSTNVHGTAHGMSSLHHLRHLGYGRWSSK